MGQKTKGKCKYCGKEYTMGYIGRHMKTCKERQKKLASESGKKKCGYFELAVCAKYNRDYWLFIEMRETATLRDLDLFLRDIWLECCGHLSAFDINGTSYEAAPSDDWFWGEPAKDMNYQLKSVLETGMTISYEYDFGSPTDLVITVKNYRIGCWRDEKLILLSRNNPPTIMCDRCGERPAVVVCPERIWTGGNAFLCENCGTIDFDDDEYLLNVCNSPRVGVCGYNGSELYPDQFVPDADDQNIDKK